MKRCDFVSLLASAAAAWPLAARAQQPAMPVVGFVNIRSPEPSGRNATAFRKALNETGYVEGQNMMVEYHWLVGRCDRLPQRAHTRFEGSLSVLVGRHGAMNPAGRVRCNSFDRLMRDLRVKPQDGSDASDTR